MRITVTGIAHSFRGTSELFGGLTFDLVPGELVGLVGPSGSGKSTLLSMLAGWQRPAVGSITRDGIVSVAWVFQNPHGSPRRTAVDHVVVPLLTLGCRRAEATAVARDLLDEFGLGAVADRRYSTLSGGEAQRLMFACAVAKGPSLLLVDEPTAQLDPTTSATVNAVLGKVANPRTIVVVATHDPETADVCARRVDLSRPGLPGGAT